jgi:small-conductance mechanosensitive channel
MRIYLILFLTLFAFLCFAQEETVQEDTSNVVTAYEVTQITKNIEAEARLIGEIKKELEDNSIKIRSDSLIPLYTNEYEILTQKIESGLYLRVSPLEQEQLLRELNAFISKIQAFDLEFTDRLQVLNDFKKKVEENIKRWRKTRDDNANEEGFTSIREKIYDVITQLLNLNTDLDRRISSVLEKQSQIADISIQALNDKVTLENALSESERQLFVRNKGYIWNEFTEHTDSVGFVATVIHGLDIHWRSGKDFYNVYERTIFFHGVLFIIFLYTMWSLSRQREKIEDLLPDEFSTSLKVLSSPFAAAVIPPLVLTYWIYQGAPNIVFHIAFLLTIPPLFIIIFRNLEGQIKIIIILMIFSQILESFYINISSESPFFRFLLLANSILILVTYMMFARKMSLLYQLDHKKSSLIFLSIGRIGMIASFSAIVLSIIGFESLSNYLIRGVVSTATLGLLTFVSATILTGIVTLYIYSPGGQRGHLIRLYSKETRSRFANTIRFVAIVLWLELSLTLFTAFYDLREGFVNLWNFSFSMSEDTTGLTVGSIIIFFGIVYLSIVISRFLRLVFDVEIQQRYSINQDISSTISILIRYSLITLGFIIAIIASGFSLDRLAILIGALGVGIGFGLQNIINNLISGLILAFERPVKVGDIIEVSNLSLIGTVKEIGIRASIIRTFDETEVIVPNGNIISNEVVNWTLSDKIRRNTVEVGVQYRTDPDTVLEVLIKQAKLNPHIMDQPEPFALFTGFGDSSLNFKLYFWTADYDRRLRTLSEVHVAVNNALKEAGITIPFPQRDLHIKTVEDQASRALKEGPTNKTGKSEK